MKSKIEIILVILTSSLLAGQEYKIQFSHIPIGQGTTTKDSIKIVNSIGGAVSKDISSDSFAVGSGFFNATQSLLAESPVISDFDFSGIIEKNGDPAVLSATIYDLNGISEANLYLQIGGSSEELIFPMSRVSSSIYEVLIPDSLIGPNNFRARIMGVDNMSYSTTSDYFSTQIQLSNSELTMKNKYSAYPDGIEKEEWKLMSWPSQVKNTTLAFSELDDGHVFYAWEPVKESYSIANQIKKGQAYWFRHSYKETVLFQEDTSFALPLNEFVIDLEKGWNLIGNPFSFPVTFSADTSVSPPIAYGLFGIGKGWSSPQNVLLPWNGYAVYTDDRATMTLLPFEEQDTSLARVAFSGDWYLNIKLESKNQINHSTVLGRRKYASNGAGIFDAPMFPGIENNISIAMDLDGSTGFKYIRDIRSLDDFNGVWNLRINDLGDEFMISSNQMGPFPEGLQVGLININERKVLLNFLDHKEMIANNQNSVYDLKIIAGDKEYVKSMSQEILSSIPEEFSLGQNYPNPFNPITQMEYSLPQSSKVVISIYNVLGQEIKTLVNKEQDYGYHSVSWDGTDRLGKSVASGVYFTQMRSDGFSQSKKMLLLK